MSLPGPPIPAPDPRSSGNAASPQLAGFGLRLIGRIMDGVILIAPIFLWIYFLSDPSASASSSEVLFYLVLLAFSFANDVALTAFTGGTLGKLICGTRVVRVADRRPVTMGTAMMRWVVIVVLGVVPFGVVVDALWIFSGELKQTLHDKAAGTTVVRVQI